MILQKIPSETVMHCLDVLNEPHKAQKPWALSIMIDATVLTPHHVMCKPIVDEMFGMNTRFVFC